MFRSMTGFGRGRVCTDGYDVRADVRSVNNRSLRIVFRLPETLQGLEAEFEKQVRSVVARGTVSVAMDLDEIGRETGYVVDTAMIRSYCEALVRLRDELGLEGEPSLDVLAALPGAIRKQSAMAQIPEELSGAVREALDAALAELVRTRAQEGAAILKDILYRRDMIAALVKAVEERLPRMLDEYSKRLSVRLGALLERAGASLTEEDVRREVVIFAERSDITEEITRLRSHLDLMDDVASSEEPCGRKVDFICQEMFREANTIASKANDADIVRQALEIKSEVEKIREQALNVE